jgi:tetratricopeptide (TPR) repeat protein
MEAGWLLAAMAVPLFFNIYSSRVFEPDKLTLLRSIALVVLTAWLCKLIETSFASFRTGEGSFWARTHRANPLTFPVLFLIAIYLVSTVASVAPYVSVWGSYQRLQGTYSTFSYIVIFAAMLHAMKTRAQLERLLTVMVLVSLPISAYGWLQHFKLDPLPWGGDVTERIASSMGNAIFIGAYLILILPITIGRWLNIVVQVLRAPNSETNQNGANVSSNGQTNTPASTSDLPQLVMAGCYTFIIAFQLLAIYWSGSRGPWIGILAGLFVFLFLFGVRRRLNWLWAGSLSLAIGGIAFLLLLNTPNSPLEPIKASVPALGRLGSVFSEGGTNKVRFLIWEGAVQLVSPHEPIGFDKYTDNFFNPIRPLIGYGPEAMYVAYNKFYPPDLAHYEARNASPDRSHNETFDSLVITGLIGFIAYLTLFGAVFYYGFKWLGLGGGRRDFIFFTVCWLVCGAIGAGVGYYLDVDTARYIGVALPVGLLFGVLIYLVSQALIFKRGQPMPPLTEDQILLIALLGTIVAHFIEIHFGIAIAATRTYFWISSALLVLLGLRFKQPAPATASTPLTARTTVATIPSRVTAFAAMAARNLGLAPAWSLAPVTHDVGDTHLTFARKRRREKVAESRITMPTTAPQARALPSMSSWGNAVITYGLLLGALMMIMVFNFISPNFGQAANSVWIYALIMFVIIVASLFMAAQVQVEHGRDNGFNEWSTRFLLILLVGLTVMAIYWVIHLPRLTVRPSQNIVESIWTVANTIALFYGYFFTLLVLLAVFLMQEGPYAGKIFNEPFFAVVYVILLTLCGMGVVTTNLDSIRADIFYKQGLTFDGQGQWDGSLAMYEQAIKLAPDQDFYYLFFGRAYLEKAKRVADLKQREQLLQISKQQLERARELNPLNTDHTANLARLYRTWAELTSEPAQRATYLNQSLTFYEQSKLLSPNNAQLYNEHATVYMLLGQTAKALEKLEQSLKIDKEFGQTYLLLGDIYLNKQDPATNEQNWLKAAEAYSLALKYDPNVLQAHSALGLIYSRLNRIDEAIAENLIVVNKSPNDASSLRNLALLYQQKGDLAQSLNYARRALAVATSDGDKQALQGYIAVWQSISDNQAALAKNPTDYPAMRNLITLYQQAGKPTDALAIAQRALSIAPDNEKPALQAFISQTQSITQSK